MKKSKPTAVNPHPSLTPKTASWYSAAELPALLLIALYALVDFVPPLGGADVMGAQWLYLSIIHVAASLYLFTLGKERLAAQLGPITGSLLSVLLLSFTLLAGLSILGAINRIESMVVYARLLTTVLMYFQIGLLVCGRLELLKLLAYLFSILLLIQSLLVINQFASGVSNETALDSIIANIKVNTGNKNILAASLAIKLAFTLYAIWQSSFWLRFLLSLLLFLATCAIVIVNARASFVSLGVQLLLLLIFLGIHAYRTKKIIPPLIEFTWSFIPILIGVLLSNWALTYAKNLQEGPSTYGTVAERAMTLNLKASGRENLWLSALDYIKQHPLQGAGYGNWKLASIPYEREHIDELFVAYHAHNDFLEMTAETGWLGGALYLSLFALSAIWLLWSLIQKNNTGQFFSGLGVALGLTSYFTDGSFNFPAERPIMQFFLALTLAWVVQLRLANQKTAVDEIKGIMPTGKDPSLSRGRFISFAAISVLALSFSGFFNFKVYESMQAQFEINGDMLQANPQFSYQKVNKELPNVPNLNAFCFPVTLIKSRYLIKEKDYTKALALLHSCRGEAPYLSINEFFTAQCHLELFKKDSTTYSTSKDSAMHWARLAFTYRPRVRNNYILFNQLLSEVKDSATIESNFKITSKLRNEPWVWSSYLSSLAATGRISDAAYAAIVDSAVTKFPEDTTLIAQRKELAILQSKPFLEAATRAFQQQNFQEALNGFLKAAEINPSEYANIENVGLCYHAMKRYDQAIQYFDKVINLKIARDAKSYYFKALCLIQIGQKSAACATMQIAANSNYADASKFLQDNCR